MASMGGVFWWSGEGREKSTVRNVLSISRNGRGGLASSYPQCSKIMRGCEGGYKG
jgi:hypothetical protein